MNKSKKAKSPVQSSKSKSAKSPKSKPVGQSQRRQQIYFDNNGTTVISPKAAAAFNEWLDCYNPSTNSKLAKPSVNALETAKDEILNRCNVSSATHTIIFTSGASESNCFIIRACVKSFKKKLIEHGSEITPHIILSAIEHNASMSCVKDLMDNGEVTASFIQPTIYGNILAADVEKEIKPNTCLVSIMYANNEIPVINNIREIGIVANKHGVPLHSDAVQIFGKYPIDIKLDHIDAISASAHKFYGPKGVGLLIINLDLVTGYNLTGEINGTQQSGLRGGTENIPGIVSMRVALKNVFVDRVKKNAHLRELRSLLLSKLAEDFTFVPYNKFLETEKHLPVELISLGPPEDKQKFILPNCILLAVCKNKGKPFCNVELKNYLEKFNMFVSIGSACNTSSTHASHVLQAIGAPPTVKRGVIRISFGDYNTKKEVDAFYPVLYDGIHKQLKDIEVVKLDKPVKPDKK